APARRGVARDAQDRDLRNAQCRGGGLSRGPRHRDDAASRDRESHHSDHAAAPARSFECGISRLPEAASGPAWSASRARGLMRTLLHSLVICAAALAAGLAEAATLKVLCDGPLEPALPAIGEAFKTKTKHQVEFVFAPSPIIHKRIMDGESA